MARAAKVPVVRYKMTTKEFAVIKNVTPETVCRYCRKINGGESKVLRALREWGLVSVKRLPTNRWSLTVKVKEKRCV